MALRATAKRLQGRARERALGCMKRVEGARWHSHNLQPTLESSPASMQSYFFRQEPPESEPAIFEPLPSGCEVNAQMRGMRDGVNSLLELWSSAPNPDFDMSAFTTVSRDSLRMIIC